MEKEDDVMYDRYYCNCIENGDVWNMHFTPFTFDEWVEVGRPLEGGVQTSYGKLCQFVKKMVTEERKRGAVYKLTYE